MENNLNDLVYYVFSHPKIKESIQNYQYVCSLYLKNYLQDDNDNYNKAMGYLEEIRNMENPTVCRGMFLSAIKYFKLAEAEQTDMKRILSNLGLMYCYYRLKQIDDVVAVQVSLSSIEYKGSFWDRYGGNIKNLGAAGFALIAMLCGVRAPVAVAGSAQGARMLTNDHRSEVEVKRKIFEHLRNSILRLNFTR